jgi:hypothetical protein
MEIIFNFNQLIESATFDFHNKSGTLPFPLLLEGESFGKFNINMKKTEITKIPLFILFTIDNTGSMDERENDKFCKMDYLKKTFKNMISYLAKQNIDIYIRVHSFNISVDIVIENECVTPENMTELIKKIDALEPECSTNIELALNKAQETLHHYAESYPEHQIAHVFMTDGDPTIGQTCKFELAKLVDERFANIFVGFGIEHNALLLKKLSEKKNAEYQFVDDMENTGLVYGETLHRFLYPALSTVEIRVTNGLIYDWQTNQWTEQVYEPVLISEAQKTYHLRTSNPRNIKIDVYSNGDFVCSKDCLDKSFTEECDIMKYVFRQKVQELLYFARNSEVNKKPILLKAIFKEVFKTIRMYMRENELVDDPFMKMLCDDISVTYKTMGTRFGPAFATARQTSQGRQQSYTPSRSKSYDNEPALNRRPKMVRQPTRTFHGKNPLALRIPSEDEFDLPIQSYNSNGVDSDCMNIIAEKNYEDDLDNFNSSNDIISCYATQTVLKTMRSISQSLDV